MAKTRALHWKAPLTQTCSYCDGSGIYSGMFSSGPCAQCDGSGIVGTDGEALPHDDLVAIMRQRLEDARTRYRRLLNTPGVREAIQAERQRRHEAAMGYGTNKNQGD